jgi:hypothetical protein
MFEIVKMTHICQYWRSTLISSPRLWSSIFVKNDHKDFVAACLERSRGAPLTVYLDLKHGDYHDYPDCTCIRNEWSPGMQIDEDNPCRYHTTIQPLLTVDSIKRICKLDVCLTMLDASEEGPDQDFKNALDDLDFFVVPLPFLESLSFSVNHELEIDTHLSLPRDLFGWVILPPTRLRHLTLQGCYGGPIRAARNLTSFELAGEENFDPIALTQRTFLPFISGSPSLVSLILSHCEFSEREQLSRVTPVKLSRLKTLRLMGVYGLSGLPGLMEVPAFKTLSSLGISTRKHEATIGHYNCSHFEVHAGNGDGFQLFYDGGSTGELVSEWLGIMRNADPSLTFIRLEGRDLDDPSRDFKGEVSPLPLFVNAKILEINSSFSHPWYRDFWSDLEKIGPQLTTLRLEVTEGMSPTKLVESVEKFAQARLEKGMPLRNLEKMEFEGMSEEDQEKAKKCWEEFRASLKIDEYLALQ